MKVNDLLDIFYRSYVLKKLKKNTSRGYLVNINNHLKPFFEGFDIDMITYDSLDDFCDYMSKQKRLKVKTTKYALATLRKALNFAIRRGYISYNIFNTWDMPKDDGYKYVVFTEDECSLLLSYLVDVDSDILMPVYLSVRHGLRRGECMGLRVTDISKNSLYIHNTAVCFGKAIHEGSPKTKNSIRHILLDDLDNQYLDRYNSTRKANKDGYLCRGHDGTYVTSNVLQHRYKKALKMCGLPNIRFHDLRHTFATLMLGKDVNPKIVCAILGHSDVKTTLSIYSHECLSMQKYANDVSYEYCMLKKGLIKADI